MTDEKCWGVYLSLLIPVELRHLRYFVRVAEHENVARAAFPTFDYRIATPATHFSPQAEKFWRCAKEAALARLPQANP